MDIKTHPCFQENSCHNSGRLHIPVTYSCNLKCKFCRISNNDYEYRPGVTTKLITKYNVIPYIEKALQLCPEIKVVGIAGPGESLMSENLLDILDIIHKTYPNLILCLSTNGLLLPDLVNQLVSVGVSTISVTINAIEPFVISQCLSYILYNGEKITGLRMGELLVKKQLKGISMAVKLGLVVKVNTVLIPEINSTCILDIAKTISNLGAFIYNIIPLIPEGELVNMDRPKKEELLSLQEKATKFIRVKKTCNRCRADACGIPGNSEYYKQLGEFYETNSILW